MESATQPLLALATAAYVASMPAYVVIGAYSEPVVRWAAMPDGRLESINTSNGGVPKTSVFEALITGHGLSGDAQGDLRHHGGPDRAVVLFSLELIRALQEEGHPIGAGTIGENLTVSGLDWVFIVPGIELQIGPVRLHITEYAAPCTKIAGSFRERDFERVDQDVHPGWSRMCARVIEGGIVRPGDEVNLVRNEPLTSNL